MGKSMQTCPDVPTPPVELTPNQDLHLISAEDGGLLHRRRRTRLAPLVGYLSLLLLPGAARAQAPQEIADQAELAFARGQMAESVAAFDRLARLVPDIAPILWQRGIA